MNLAFALLLPFLQGDPLQREAGAKNLDPKNLNPKNKAPCLLIADENLHGENFSGIHQDIEIISNRFDIAQAASTAGLAAQFSDFDFSAYPSGYFACICYRVSKEKAVVEHIIDQALHLLRDGGELILCGAKNEGIKRYAGVAAEHFHSSANTRKQSTMYLARIIKPLLTSGTESSEAPGLSSNYSELIPIKLDHETTLYTKAGAFGSAKIDQGSQMLAGFLGRFFEGFQAPPKSLLDLGCGYGYLSACAARFGLACIVATDNCAAAIDTCQANMTRLKIPAEVIADDCAQGITVKFDAIVCNPPFHQGFKTDSALTEKFVRSAAQHLKPGGKALFVVNQFVPLEKIAGRMFLDVDVVERDQSFKLIVMTSAFRP
ncbi:MAG: methyltransferase [Porticoccaceae bacterium]|nr:methyltransferase [Porticoccaceae bacterium]